MPFSELPLSVLVFLFLVAFVVVGIYPALKRAVSQIRRQLQAAAQAKEPMAELFKRMQATANDEVTNTGPLNDFEIIMLRRLARAEGKALSRRQVNAPLLFSEESLDRTLRSLNRRGLVHMKVSPLFRQQFSLSEAGRRYAIEQDYIVRVHQGKK